MSEWEDFGPQGARDRALARKPRYGGNRIETFDHLVKDFLRDEDVARMKRFARVRGTLDRVLGPLSAKVQPLRLVQGQLTLEVADGILLAELRSHRQAALLAALAEDRTGVTRVVWRVGKTGNR